MALPLDFTGKTIVVIGCHKGGMGGATCRLIAQGGGTVVAVDWSQEYLDEIAGQVRELGATCHTMVADLMDRNQCEGLIPSIIEKFGPIDGLANIAGGTRAEEWMPLDETPAESFWMTIQLNFAYVFYTCRDAAKYWIDNDRPGAIVNIGSISAKDGAAWHGPYGAGKSGIIALTRTMASEWHEFDIRANSVSPGAVASERVYEKSSRMDQRVIDGRDTSEPVIFCMPEDLANGIVFLLSDLASGISGQNLTVDKSLSTKFCGSPRRSRKEMMGQ